MKKILGVLLTVLLTVVAAVCMMGVASYDGDDEDECEHQWIFQPGTPATCEEGGVADARFCKKCYQYEGGRPKPIAPLGHDYVTEEAVEPTCEHVGYTAGQVCTRCNRTEGRTEIPALGHDVKFAEAKQPACTQSGRTAGSYCGTCGKILEGMMEQPALGHKVVRTEEKAPTCTDEGVTAEEICEVCKEILKEGTLIPPLGHNSVTERKEATCTEAGYEKTVCTRCGETSITEIPKKEHRHETWEQQREATCTTEGLLFSYCELCGSRAERTLSALGHEKSVVPEKQPTCEEDGYSSYTICARCDEELTEKSVLPASGHSPVERAGREATCEEDGATPATVCNVCGKTLTESEVLPATGHSYHSGELLREATCEQTGILRKTCLRCGDEKQEEIPATGHTPVVKEGCAATCTQEGVTQSTVCSVCGKGLQEGEILARLPHHYVAGKCTECGKADLHYTPPKPSECVHEFGNWRETSATCTQDGEKRRVCNVCGREERTVLPAHGHEYGDFEEVQTPTCTEAGILERVCKYDGSHVDRRTLPAAGHKEKTTEGRSATCEEAGYTEETVCAVCATVMTTKREIQPLGHDWAQTVVKQPSYREGGEIAETCRRCHAKRQSTLDKLGGIGEEFLNAVDALRAAEETSRKALAEAAKSLYERVEHQDLVAEDYAYLKEILESFAVTEPTGSSDHPSPDEREEKDKGEGKTESDGKLILMISLSVTGGIVFLSCSVALCVVIGRKKK